MLGHGDQDLIGIDLDAPGRIHRIGLAGLIISSDDQHRTWREDHFLT